MEKEDKFQRGVNLKLFKKTFLNRTEHPKQEDIDFYIQKAKEIEAMSFESKRFYFLLDHSRFSLAYICKNSELQGGYSGEYIRKQGVRFLFKIIHWRQLSAFFQIHLWGPKAKELMKTADHEKTSATVCGLKLKDKQGNWRTFIVTQKMLTFDRNDDVVLSFCTAEEITYFYKSFNIWYRIVGNTKHGPSTKVFFSNGSKKEAEDLFTTRELEVLSCSVAQLSIQEIADQLELSKNTVERHRKNMIAKVGVTNMTGVIRVSQILNLI